jgi:hypothetical protein
MCGDARAPLLSGISIELRKPPLVEAPSTRQVLEIGEPPQSRLAEQKRVVIPL